MANSALYWFAVDCVIAASSSIRSSPVEAPGLTGWPAALYVGSVHAYTHGSIRCGGELDGSRRVVTVVAATLDSRTPSPTTTHVRPLP